MATRQTDGEDASRTGGDTEFNDRTTLSLNGEYFLTDDVTVFGGAGFLDSEIKENRNRPITVGNDAPQAPQETYNLGGEVMFPVADGIELFARIDYQYVGEMWFHTLQGEQTPTIWNWLVGPFGFNQDFSRARRDAYDTVNLRVGLDAEDWSITAWGRNIGDEQYLEEVIPAPEFGGSFVHPSARDAYGVEAVYRF
jgi:iron complex outermembrane receptor protein